MKIIKPFFKSTGLGETYIEYFMIKNIILHIMHYDHHMFNITSECTYLIKIYNKFYN